MSVLWIAEQRFAAGLLWHRGELAGRPARRAARESGSSWAVDVSGQTGLVDNAEGPGGTKPLAGALMALLRARFRGKETWIAFVEEDGGDAAERRVAVVRCSGGVLPAGGDAVHANASAAVEAVESAGAEGALVVVTAGLRDRFPDAVEVNGKELREAAAQVDALSAVRSGGISLKGGIWMGAFAAAGAAGIMASANWAYIETSMGWAEEEKERPRVTVRIESGRFLAYCRDEIARRELGLVGFDRLGLFCHAQYAPDGAVEAPWTLSGRPVLEVRWQLRKPLPARVYVGLAETRLEPWFWAGVHDRGDAVGFAPLPKVLERSDSAAGQSYPEFRARIDGLLALRGFRIAYPKDGGPEAVLETERPLSEAVALISGIEGLEVVSASFENGRWRFEGRRSRTQEMFEDEFLALTAPLASAAQTTIEDDTKRRVS